MGAPHRPFDAPVAILLVLLAAPAVSDAGARAVSFSPRVCTDGTATGCPGAATLLPVGAGVPPPPTICTELVSLPVLRGGFGELVAGKQSWQDLLREGQAVYRELKRELAVQAGMRALPDAPGGGMLAQAREDQLRREAIVRFRAAMEAADANGEREARRECLTWVVLLGGALRSAPPAPAPPGASPPRGAPAQSGALFPRPAATPPGEDLRSPVQRVADKVRAPPPSAELMEALATARVRPLGAAAPALHRHGAQAVPAALGRRGGPAPAWAAAACGAAHEAWGVVHDAWCDAVSALRRAWACASPALDAAMAAARHAWGHGGAAREGIHWVARQARSAARRAREAPLDPALVAGAGAGAGAALVAARLALQLLLAAGAAAPVRVLQWPSGAARRRRRWWAVQWWQLWALFPKRVRPRW